MRSGSSRLAALRHEIGALRARFEGRTGSDPGCSPRRARSRAGRSATRRGASATAGLRRPPRTLAGDVTRRLLTLAVGAAVGSASALLLARWPDRPAAIGLSVLGAVILVAALVGACTSRQRMTYEYDSAEMPLRPRPGFTFAAIGAVLILLGVLVETV